MAHRVSGNRHKTLSPFAHMQNASFLSQAPAMSEWQPGGRGRLGRPLWYHDWGFSHSFSLRTRGNLKYERIFVWQQLNPLSVSKVDHIKTSASLRTETKASKALGKKRPPPDKQWTVCIKRKDKWARFYLKCLFNYHLKPKCGVPRGASCVQNGICSFLLSGGVPAPPAAMHMSILSYKERDCDGFTPDQSWREKGTSIILILYIGSN